MLEYIDQFHKINDIWLDPIYTGRLALALDYNFHLLDQKKRNHDFAYRWIAIMEILFKRWPNAEYIINIEELKR